MKNFAIRLAVYIPIISFFWWIFVPSFFDPFPGPIVGQIISSIVYFGMTYGFWIFAYEAAYHAVKSLRKSKPLPAPETQPLSTAQQASIPTRPIDPS